jgi:hypothetical protein
MGGGSRFVGSRKKERIRKAGTSDAANEPRTKEAVGVVHRDST